MLTPRIPWMSDTALQYDRSDGYKSQPAYPSATHCNVLFVHFGDPWIRGSERVLLDTFRQLDRSRFTPVLWCNTDIFAEAARCEGIYTRRSDFQCYLQPWSPPFSWREYRRLVSSARALIKEQNIGIVHVNSAAPTQFMLPAARFSGIPILTHLHAHALRRTRYVTALHLVDRLLGVSSSVLQDFVEDGISPARIDVLSNGIDPERLVTGNRANLRASLGFGRDDIVIAVVGSLIYRKGHDILFRALHHIGRMDPALHVLIIGDGPLRASIENLGRDPRFHFLGECSDVGAILRDTVDLLVVPSRREAFGLVIAEAGFFGIPAIGSNVDGIPEVISDEETGILIPPEDDLRLAAAIIRLAKDRALRLRMGRAARSRVLANFMIRETVKKLEHIYESILAHQVMSHWWANSALRPYWRIARSRGKTTSSRHRE